MSFHYWPRVFGSLRNSTWWIDGQSVHQWAYLWWSDIYFWWTEEICNIQKGVSKSWFHQVMLHGPPSHWSPISLVPFSLVPQLIGPPIHYWSSLVPHLIGPPYHWSPISLVPLFIRHPIIGQSQWSPISLVPHLIGSPSHWSPNSSVSHLIGPPIGTHASLIPLVPHLIGPPTHWSPISLVPQLTGPLLIGPPIHKSPTTYWSPFSFIQQTSGKLLDLYRTGGPVNTWKIHVLPVLQNFYRTSPISLYLTKHVSLIRKKWYIINTCISD